MKDETGHLIMNVMEDEIKIFVIGLKKIAKRKKITQAMLGEAIGKDQTTISNYYNFKTRPTFQSIKKLSARIESSFEEIVKVGREALDPSGGVFQKQNIERIIENKVAAMLTATSLGPEISKEARQNNIRNIGQRKPVFLDKFPDPETAEHAIENLFKIARANPTLYNEVCEYIEWKAGRVIKDPPTREGPGNSVNTG